MVVPNVARKITEAVRHKDVGHASLALQYVIKEIEPENPCQILDLGRACSSNIKFYSKYSRQFHFEDLPAAMSALHEKVDSPGSDQSRSVLDGALCLRKNQQFDLVLCWDILSYLSREEVRRLGQIFAEHSKPSTKIFILLPIGSEISSTPMQFEISTEDHLLYAESAGHAIPGPRYSKTDLKKLWPAFSRKKSFLLKNGYEEHIYCKN